MGSLSPQDGTYDVSWESKVRDLLISLEIRARCEEWRRGDIRKPRIARALRDAQRELRGAIWLLGVRSAAQPTTYDPWLISELRSATETLRRGPIDDEPTLARLADSLDALSAALRHTEGGSSRGGPFRRPPLSPPDAETASGHARVRAPWATTSLTDVARAAVFVALMLGGMAAASTGLGAFPLAMLIVLAAYVVGTRAPREHAR